MSSLYNLEPLPTAKCVLHTTSGDLEFELFAAQAPQASRSFLQHCLDGYYEGTLFHRLVPGFILQGGDPTGTGSGGESALEGGRPFADEFNSRLKFNRRGLLGMANGGKKDDNGSQFFLTLGKTEELTGKHTMFGRIQGSDTIYNLVKMGEAELVEGEDSDRPLYPTKITGADVLVNPFEDMVKRDRVVSTHRQELYPPRKKVKKTKTRQLLSFGGDDEDDDGVSVVKGLANPKLVDKIASHSNPVRPKSPSKRRLSPSIPLYKGAATPPSRRSIRSPSSSEPSSPEPVQSEHDALMSKAKAEIAELKSSLRRNVAVSAPEPDRKKSALEAMIPATATRGRKRRAVGNGGGTEPTHEEQKALAEFRRFQQRLELANSALIQERNVKEGNADKVGPELVNEVDEVLSQLPNHTNEDEDEADVCDLHFVPNCQSCSRWEREDAHSDDDESDIKGLMSHRLTFERDRRGKDLEWKRQNERILEIFDTAERAREFGAAKRGVGERRP